MGFADRLKALFGLAGKDRDLFFDELADLLVEGDLGAALADELCTELRRACGSRGCEDLPAMKRELKTLLSAYGKQVAVEPPDEGLGVVLLLGVNGVGKTTSAAKLAHRFSRKLGTEAITLAAGDTFRAAAIDQLRLHGTRLGIRVVAQEQGSDPAAVIFDAINSALSVAAPGAPSLVIADTAGRMHTRSDLVRELGKIDRVIATKAPGASIRRLLVLDATTGQNGLRQAEIFSEAVPVDGLILTKFDSTAKGGLSLAIARRLGIPTAFLGTGEGYDDFRPFVLDTFLDDFLGMGR